MHRRPCVLTLAGSAAETSTLQRQCMRFQSHLSCVAVSMRGMKHWKLLALCLRNTCRIGVRQQGSMWTHPR